MSADNVAVTAFGLGPFFFHERDAGEAHFEKCLEIVFRQIAFQPPAFAAFRFHYQNGRCPDGTEAFEIARIFFDMHPERDKIFVDERCQTGIAVRLVFEPLTSTSGRRSAEIDEQRFVLFFRGVQCLIGIFDPIYGHLCNLLIGLYAHRLFKEYSQIHGNLNADEADRADLQQIL